jgi:hypothetical protein
MACVAMSFVSMKVSDRRIVPSTADFFSFDCKCMYFQNDVCVEGFCVSECMNGTDE